MACELEICISCDTLSEAVQNARAAASGGADRLECCADMTRGGLTPDPGIIEAIRTSVDPEVSVLVMVRPRDGGFEWSSTELAQMQQSVTMMAEAGADGIVSGGLQQGRIDRELTGRLISQTHAAGMQFTFHRAIDAADERMTAIAALKEAGCDRILSAGTSWQSGLGALDGSRVLVDTAGQLNGTVELVVGGGISSSSLRQLLPVFKHHRSISFHAYSSVLMGGATHVDRVRELRKLIDAV